MTDNNQAVERKLTFREKAFVEAFLSTWSNLKAAQIAGYKQPDKSGTHVLSRPHIRAVIEKRLEEMAMTANEVIARLSEQAALNSADFYNFDTLSDGKMVLKSINWNEYYRRGHLVKRITYNRKGEPVLEFYDAQFAQDRIGRFRGLFSDKLDSESLLGASGQRLAGIPAELIGSSFSDVYRAVLSGNFTEFLIFGGRGSLKSTFVSEVMIMQLVNHPNIHGLALRQVADTLRDSVYAQLVWAIGELGLTDEFACTTNPMEITYKPTQQKIYFRGANDPGKIKSIKPKFGHIGLLWFEELDQFHGEEGVRKIEQSVMRGGDFFLEFKTWNPPKTANSWATKYTKIPKVGQYQHSSDYRSVPHEWLGKPFIDEAEHIKEVNPKAYEHEYLGISNGTGGLVFENVTVRQIPDDEIATFGQYLHGLDWGYYPDPLSFGRMYYDTARLKLYIFGEFRANKMGNRQAFNKLVDLGLIRKDEVFDHETNKTIVSYPDLIIADSAEPKSVADFREFGANIIGAEKGPDSVDYSMKWLQSLTEIVIDPVRAPAHAEEFINYELEQDKEGNFISQYPDKNNHSIDDTRYATNLIWRVRGK